MSTCARNTQRLEISLLQKFTASSWLILTNKYIEMQGQQKIKKNHAMSLQYQQTDVLHTSSANSDPFD